MGFQDFTEISRSHIDFKISLRFHRISLRFARSHSDFKFQDLKISLRSQDFCGISRFHRDFRISHRFQDLTKISQDLTKISQDLTEILQDQSHSRSLILRK